jgi:plastocyanin
MKRIIGAILPILAAIVAVAVVNTSGCSGDDTGPSGVAPPPGSATTTVVQMRDNSFNPRDVTISRGDTIVWFNAGNANHTTTSGTALPGDGLWNSGTDPADWMRPGTTFLRAFDDTTGTFAYFCIPHVQVNMRGTVTVNP